MSKTPIVEIIAIGREILDGRVVDTNSVVIAEKLKRRGLTIRFAQKVDDDMDRILESFSIAERRSNIILVTGGLGPTSDDITAEAFGRFLGEKNQMNPDALKQIEEVFLAMGRPMYEIQKKQAVLPPSCFLIRNTQGTAPGFGIEHNGKSWFFMPGVPIEMKEMLKLSILPKLPNIEGFRVFTWATHFTSEGGLQEKLTSVEKKLKPGFELTYRTKFPENHIGLYATCNGSEDRNLYESLCGEIDLILGDDVFSKAKESEHLASLEEVVLKELQSKEIWMCTVESCTGGLIAKRMTDINGSSSAFWGSFVTYDNFAKEYIGVPRQLLKTHGAVSSQTAESLSQNGLQIMMKQLVEAKAALGSRKKDTLGSRGVCIATTGIAGPGGGTTQKPVGLCFISMSFTLDGKKTQTIAEEIKGRPGMDRLRYRDYFAQKALDLIRKNI